MLSNKLVQGGTDLVYILVPFVLLLLALALCIYINPGPNVRQSNKTAWLKQVPIAHRGLHTDDADVPENSIHAFRRAIDKGYGIEIDVQLSADGRVIVFHDYNLKRMIGLDMNTADLTWDQLEGLRLLDGDQGIPLLKDLLSLIDGKVPLLIEVKNEGAVGPLEQALIDDLQDYTGDFAIQAFNPFVLAYIKKHAPQYIRGQLSSDFKNEDLAWWKKFVLRYLLLNKISEPSFVAYETGTLPGWLAKRLKQKGLYLLTWTVKDMESYKRDIQIFDNVIFEGFEAPRK